MYLYVECCYVCYLYVLLCLLLIQKIPTTFSFLKIQNFALDGQTTPDPIIELEFAATTQSTETTAAFDIINRPSTIVCGQTLQLSYPASAVDSDAGQQINWVYQTNDGCLIDIEFDFINVPSQDSIEIYRFDQNGQSQLFSKTGGQRSSVEELPKLNLNTNLAKITILTDDMPAGSRFGARIVTRQGKFCVLESKF